MLKLSARLVRMDPSVVEEIEDEIVQSSPVEVWLDGANVAALAQAILDAPIGPQPASESVFGELVLPGVLDGLDRDAEEVIDIVKRHAMDMRVGASQAGDEILDGRPWRPRMSPASGKAALMAAVSQVLARAERRGEERALAASSGV